MKFAKIFTLALFSLVFLFSVSGFEPPEPWPNEFEGEVSVNGESPIDRELRVLVEGEVYHSFEVDGSDFDILVEGDEGHVVEFEIENETSGFTKYGDEWIIEDFGEVREVELDFELVDPDPTLSISLEQSFTDSLLVPMSTNLLDKEADVYLDYNGTETESREINESSSGEEFNITGLDYDSVYNVTGFLETEDGELFNSSQEFFRTDNLDGVSVVGDTGVNRSVSVYSEINGVEVFNDTVSGGKFSFNVDYSSERSGEQLAVSAGGDTNFYTFESGKRVEPDFGLEPEEGDDDGDESESGEDSDILDDSSESDDEAEETSEEQEEEDSESEEETIESDSENEEEGDLTSATGQFIQSQTDSTTLVLFLGVSLLGIYVFRELN